MLYAQNKFHDGEGGPQHREKVKSDPALFPFSSGAIDACAESVLMALDHSHLDRAPSKTLGVMLQVLPF